MSPRTKLWHFIYVFQNQTQFGYHKVSALHISKELHKFFVQYAKKFAYVHLPTPRAEVLSVSAKQSNKIGKAMITHSMLLGWQISKQNRENILKTRRVHAKNLPLTKIWLLLEFFLRGGEIQILGNTEGYYLGNHFAAMDPGDYSIVLTTDRQEIATICRNAQIKRFNWFNTDIGEFIP